MSNEDRLAELLQSPLDLDPGGSRPGGRRAWILGGLGAVAAAAVLVLLLFQGDGSGPSATTLAEADPGGGDAPATTAGASGEGSGTTSADAGEALPEVPGEVVFQEMAATGDGLAVMFGGLVRLTEFDTAPAPDTWLFDTTAGTWTRLELEDSPTPRAGHSMVYHPPTGQVVLFGGGSTDFAGCRLVRRCPGPQDAQLWLFDVEARTWSDATRVVPEDEEGTWPEFRYGAGLVFDESSGNLILHGGVGVFGGRNPLFYDDTWVLDVEEARWTRLDIADPPPGRTFHQMAYLDGRVYMFGGDGPAGSDDDRLWALDLEAGAWEVIAEEGPSARWMSLMVVDPVGSRLVLAGGEGNIFNQISESVAIREVSETAEVWTWSEAEGWVLREPLPEAVIWPAGFADPATESVLLHDGVDVLRWDRGLDLWASITS